jgi:Xylanase inhibitor N-terminal
MMPAAELSSSEGWLVSDVVHLPDGGAPLPLVFGCEDKETGAIYKQRADGVLGMGNAANALPQQVCYS